MTVPEIKDVARVCNGGSVALRAISPLPFQDFRTCVINRMSMSRRMASFFGWQESDHIALMAVLAVDHEGMLEVVQTRVDTSFDSLTPDVPQAHWFEREIAEQWGVSPEGHPWLKPIRFHRSWRTANGSWEKERTEFNAPGVTDYFRVEGDEIHEVAVGPVHAGVIEPGHFRFQCHGETVLHLEIELGYQHRGIEKAIVAQPLPGAGRTIHFMETAAGDTTIGHTTAYMQIMERLRGIEPPRRAQSIRAIALELERLANHTGDLGALAGDVGYLPTASYCGRLRGDFLNAMAMLCGNRFGRNLIIPGGVRFNPSNDCLEQLKKHVDATFRGTRNAVDLLWKTPSVMARFEDTGRVSAADADRLGWVGPAARASGVVRDVRYDLPWGAYRDIPIRPVSEKTGDVWARARVRWLEIERSAAFIINELAHLPEGPVVNPGRDDVEHSAVVVALVEGWRGEICHTALTDETGRIVRYKIVDPSFHNWFALAMSLRNQEISDFPLCNKSFNLSYCGHDL